MKLTDEGVEAIMDIKQVDEAVAVSKSLYNSDENPTTKNVSDVEFFGTRDVFKLISKASSEAEGWMKSTKAMEIKGSGCLVQVTTQQRNPDGSYAVAEALQFIPNTKIIVKRDENGEVVERSIVDQHTRSK